MLIHDMSPSPSFEVKKKENARESRVREGLTERELTCGMSWVDHSWCFSPKVRGEFFLRTVFKKGTERFMANIEPLVTL